MRPEVWRCSCTEDDGSALAHSPYSMACHRCGELAPWFQVIRAGRREDVASTKGMEA